MKTSRALINKLTDTNKKNQVEINQLLEKMQDQDNSKIQDIVVANYNKLRESYQVNVVVNYYRMRFQRK